MNATWVLVLFAAAQAPQSGAVCPQVQWPTYEEAFGDVSDELLSAVAHAEGLGRRHTHEAAWDLRRGADIDAAVGAGRAARALAAWVLNRGLEDLPTRQQGGYFGPWFISPLLLFSTDGGAEALADALRVVTGFIESGPYVTPVDVHRLQIFSLLGDAPLDSLRRVHAEAIAGLACAVVRRGLLAPQWGPWNMTSHAHRWLATLISLLEVAHGWTPTDIDRLLAETFTDPRNPSISWNRDTLSLLVWQSTRDIRVRNGVRVSE